VHSAGFDSRPLDRRNRLVYRARVASATWLQIVAVMLGSVGNANEGLLADSITQSIAEPAAKAAFLFNVGRFAEWPDMPASGPIVFCVPDADVAEALESVARGRLVRDRPVLVRRPRSDSEHRDCSLLYTTRQDRASAGRLLETLGNAPVLTVSDQRGFAELGGMVEVFIDDGRLAFIVNRAAVGRAGLRLSAQLLRLARKEGI
jgi:hypothetical protein